MELLQKFLPFFFPFQGKFRFRLYFWSVCRCFSVSNSYTQRLAEHITCFQYRDFPAYTSHRGLCQRTTRVFSFSYYPFGGYSLPVGSECCFHQAHSFGWRRRVSYPVLWHLRGRGQLCGGSSNFLHPGDY